LANKPSPREVILFPDKLSLSHDAAHRFISLAAQKVSQRQDFNVALAGGSTPAQLYSLLAASPFYEAVGDWAMVNLFFGDERCVPPDSPDSNYHMAHSIMVPAAKKVFGVLPLPAEGGIFHRMPAELPDQEAAALQYEQTLRRHFRIGPGEFPRFDLILLGMGPDGHCASLFPHKPALQERERLVVATEPGLKPFVPRLTLTLPVLNNAANILFLVAGEDKAEALARVLTGPRDPQGLPSQSVLPTDGTVTWLVDREAASRLSPVR